MSLNLLDGILKTDGQEWVHFVQDDQAAMILEIGRQLERLDHQLYYITENDWWESYEGQADDEIVETLTKMMVLWEDYDFIVEEPHWIFSAG